MKAGLGRGLGPHHSKAPPGIRPFKDPFGGLVTLFLKLFVFLKWPLRRERGLRGGGGVRGPGLGGGGEPPGASLSPSWDPLTSFQGAFPALISSCLRRWGGAVIPTNPTGKLRLGPRKSLRRSSSAEVEFPAFKPTAQPEGGKVFLFVGLFAF